MFSSNITVIIRATSLVLLVKPQQQLSGLELWGEESRLQSERYPFSNHFIHRFKAEHQGWVLSNGQREPEEEGEESDWASVMNTSTRRSIQGLQVPFPPVSTALNINVQYVAWAQGGWNAPMSDYPDASFLTEGAELIQSVSERMNLFSDEERKKTAKRMLLWSPPGASDWNVGQPHLHTHTRIHTNIKSHLWG